MKCFNSSLCVGFGLVVGQIDLLHFQRFEDALAHRIIVGIAFAQEAALSNLRKRTPSTMYGLFPISVQSRRCTAMIKGTFQKPYENDIR